MRPNTDDENAQLVTNIFLERIRVAAAQRLPVGGFHGDFTLEMAEMYGDGLVMKLRSYVLAVPKREIHGQVFVPADWRAAIWDRFAPEWAKRRWPTRTRAITTMTHIWDRVCPHLHDHGQGEIVHIAWLAGDLL